MADLDLGSLVVQAVGENGMILRTTTGGGPVTQIAHNIYSPTEFSLEQNYPNPFNPSTKIKYTLPSVTLRQAQSDIFVTLKVYDVLGNEIATLVNEEKPAGNFEVEFNSGNLPSGLYFYTLQSGNFAETMKMLLLK